MAENITVWYDIDKTVEAGAHKMEWFITAKKADFNQIAEKFGISPVLARIIRNRDIIGDENIHKYLSGTMEDIHDPLLLKDMVKGNEIIWEKIENNKFIRVMGDYDIDGICSTYILKSAIKRCGGRVDFIIPHRMKDGYGLNDNLIQEAFQDGVDTIITCDNGISAIQSVEYAKKLGMTVVITDHHEIPYEETENGTKNYLIPCADAVIDPKQEDCDYPFKGICGGMVAYKFAQVLLGHYQIPMPNDMLELAAFSTVGDVMELQDENRIIVKYGLLSMENTKNIGLKALMDVNNIGEKKLSPYHIGFVLGPCMNATGRLDTAARALELLECEKISQAAVIAGDLKALNDNRKDMTQDALEKAIELVETTAIKEDKVLVIYLQQCHESLAGIVAGRIREKYQKPVFVLTKTEEGVKGSGRSIEAYMMYDEMTKCKELFTKYGGHKLAAGLSLPEEAVDIFRSKINELCRLEEKDFHQKLLIDIPLPINEITTEFIEELKLLEPFGNGNAKPMFAQKDLDFLSARVMGKNKNMGKYLVQDDFHNRIELIFFGDVEEFHNSIEQKYGMKALNALLLGQTNSVKMSVVYYPGINEYQQKTTLQLVMQYYQ